MTNDWKLVLNVIIGSVLLVMVVIFGLSKMASTTSSNLSAEENLLLDGAVLVKENGETKVTVVVFSDMQCPACKVADGLMTGLDSTAGVRFVFRHYPLTMHKYSVITARAVESARLMGKGWEMIELLFNKQEEWSFDSKIENKLAEYAKSLGLDEAMFKEKLNSSEVAEIVQKDLNLGNSLKLSGTPTIYVNGEQVSSDFVMAKVTELLKNGN